MKNHPAYADPTAWMAIGRVYRQEKRARKQEAARRLAEARRQRTARERPSGASPGTGAVYRQVWEAPAGSERRRKMNGGERDRNGFYGKRSEQKEERAYEADGQHEEIPFGV